MKQLSDTKALQESTLTGEGPVAEYVAASPEIAASDAMALARVAADAGRRDIQGVEALRLAALQVTPGELAAVLAKAPRAGFSDIARMFEARSQ